MGTPPPLFYINLWIRGTEVSGEMLQVSLEAYILPDIRLFLKDMFKT